MKRRPLRIVFLVVALGWAPAVVLLHGPGELIDHAGAAISIFFCLLVLTVPLWALLKALAFLNDWPERRRHERYQQGLCENCGYSLLGNRSGVCPECGTPTGRQLTTNHPQLTTDH